MNAPLPVCHTLDWKLGTLFERHGLVTVDPARLEGLDQVSPDLEDWVRQWVTRFPLVIARRTPEDAHQKILRLGLSGPRMSGKKPIRISLHCPEEAVIAYRGPLMLAEALPHFNFLSDKQKARLFDLNAWFEARAIECRLYGSYALAALSQDNTWVSSSSDLDLLLIQEEVSIEALQYLKDWNEKCGEDDLRLDGEIRIRGLGDMAWAEVLSAQSQGTAVRVLMKSSLGVRLGSPLLPRYPGASIDEIVALADEALALEAQAYPKPGLVSPVDSGSHHDMDYALLNRARGAIRQGFYDLASVARRGGRFSDLVQLGVAMERDMMRSTAGVNVYRGAIFNLGILVATAAIVPNQDLFDGVRKHFAHDILNHRPPENQHGTELRRQSGVGGVIQEAGSGFPTLEEHVLPVWHASQRAGHPPEQSLIAALMASMERLEDTNLIWRGGQNGLDLAQKLAKNFNDKGGVFAPDWMSTLTDIHALFVSKRLSPGGSADMAACAHFVGRWQQRYAA